MKRQSIMPIIAVLSLLLTISLVIAIPVGNPDEECQARGFDYGIAKYQCGKNTPDDTGSGYADYAITVVWGEDCNSVSFTANPAVDGILGKQGTHYTIFDGGTEGTIFKEYQQSFSHITLCGKNTPNVPEFNFYIGALTLISAVTLFFIVRRK